MNFIFDLDGTIIDSYKDVYESLKTAVEANNLLCNFKNDKSIMKLSLYQIINKYYPAIDENLNKKIINDYKEIYDKSDYCNTSLYPNAVDVLNKLSLLGRKIFIATNKRRVPAERILEKFDMKKYFTDTYYIDTFENINITKNELVDLLISNYSLVKTHTIIIGDTESDILAAKLNSILSVAYLNGYGNINDLKKLEPDFYISDLKEIITLFCRENKK